MSKIDYRVGANGTRYWEDEKGKLLRAEDSDGAKRFYSYQPKCHLEYIRFRNGEEWFSSDGFSARPDRRGA
ncbi:MAG: hypothetical protein H7831_16325 [Magnetococcus sp. WYHC-3]